MAIHQLNHAVLYVSELARSESFYRDVLGFERISGSSTAAFLRAPASTNDHDLGLFQVGPDSAGDGRRVGLYHLAWEVETLGDLAEMAETLSGAGALVGASDHGTTKSLYAKDPDGIEFEVVWLIPADLLTDADHGATGGPRPLDLAGELERFGADARSGIGISRPSPV